MAKRKKLKKIFISIGIGCTIVVLMLIVLPEFWPKYSCKSPCSPVESDANNIAAAISDYFAIPGRTEIKPGDLNGVNTYGNPWTFIQCGKTIYIYVYNLDEGCPVDYQNFNPEWDSHIYTKVMELSAN